MASAYTPGLTVSGDTIVRRVRRLPIKGEVLVKAGDAVNPDTVVARALLPGILQTIKLSEKLSVEPREVRNFFPKKEGDSVTKDEVVAQTKGFFGFFRAEVTSDFTGTIEGISEITGNVLVREPSIPVDITSYIKGTIAEIIPEEGAIVETRGGLVQGIFGVGGERTGVIRMAVSGPNEPLDSRHILDTDRGNILVGGDCITADALKRGAEVGVTGLIAGGIRDSDLIEYLGYDIGVAITGQEKIPLTVMVTEGFGTLAMAERTFDLLKSLEGKTASMNGATQIRAGVIRPEIIVPLELSGAAPSVATGGGALDLGSAVRIIREPYFGMIGKITELPSQLMVVESGTEVRVLKAELASGEVVCVPRANVEIIAT